VGLGVGVGVGVGDAAMPLEPGALSLSALPSPPAPAWEVMVKSMLPLWEGPWPSAAASLPAAGLSPQMASTWTSMLKFGLS